MIFRFLHPCFLLGTCSLALMVVFCFLSPMAHATENQIGLTCSGNANSADWDTIAQCSSGTFVRVNPFLAGGIAIGSTTETSGTALDVVGTILDRSYSAGSSTTISWANSNTQYTTASCGAFSFSNMQDGASYTLLIEGTTSGTCSFSNTDSPTLTFKMPSTQGATTASTMTLYHFIRAGTYVFVTWMPGY